MARKAHAESLGRRRNGPVEASLFQSRQAGPGTLTSLIRQLEGRQVIGPGLDLCMQTGVLRVGIAAFQYVGAGLGPALALAGELASIRSRTSYSPGGAPFPKEPHTSSKDPSSWTMPMIVGSLTRVAALTKEENDGARRRGTLVRHLARNRIDVVLVAARGAGQHQRRRHAGDDLPHGRVPPSKRRTFDVIPPRSRARLYRRQTAFHLGQLVEQRWIATERRIADIDPLNRAIPVDDKSPVAEESAVVPSCAA